MHNRIGQPAARLAPHSRRQEIKPWQKALAFLALLIIPGVCIAL